VVARQPDRDARLEISIGKAVYNKRLELRICKKRCRSSLDSISVGWDIQRQSVIESGL